MRRTGILLRAWQRRALAASLAVVFGAGVAIAEAARPPEVSLAQVAPQFEEWGGRDGPVLSFALTPATDLDDAEQTGADAAASDEASPRSAGSALSATEIMIQTSNPLGGDFLLLYNEWDVNFLKSDLDDRTLPIPIDKIGTKTVITHSIQPVLPFSMEDVIGENWVLVARPTLPIVYSADVPSGFTPHRESGFPGFGIGIDFNQRSGLADAQFFSLLGVSQPADSEWLGKGHAVLAGGASFLFPTGTNGFSTNAWAAGPAVSAAYVGRKAILGGLVQTQFDYASSGRKRDYDVMTVQPFYFLNFDGGWQVGGMPLMLFDFNTYEHDIPIALGFGKLALFDVGAEYDLPVRFGVEARYHLARNDLFGTEYSILFSVTPVLPNIFQNWIRGCPALSVGRC